MQYWHTVATMQQFFLDWNSKIAIPNDWYIYLSFNNGTTTFWIVVFFFFFLVRLVCVLLFSARCDKSKFSFLLLFTDGALIENVFLLCRFNLRVYHVCIFPTWYSFSVLYSYLFVVFFVGCVSLSMIVFLSLCLSKPNHLIQSTAMYCKTMN